MAWNHINAVRKQTTTSAVPTIFDVMKDPCTHTFTKEIIRSAQSKDIVDAIGDIELALVVLKNHFRIS